MNWRENKILKIGLGVEFSIYAVLFVAVYDLFDFIIKSKIGDIPVHILMLKYSLENHELPANFGFYLMAWAFSGFKIANLSIGTSLVLSLAVVAKVYYTKKFLSKYLNREDKVTIGITLLSVLLLMIHPFLLDFNKDQFMYIGYLPINVWHNSTVIFLMPFAILLFKHSIDIWEAPTRKNLIYLFLLCAINIAIKPSFFFVFILVYPIFCLHQFKLSKNFWSIIATLVISGGLVLVQFYLIYSGLQTVEQAIYNNQKSTLAISQPFELWKTFTKHVPQLFLYSIILPLFYSIFYFKKLNFKRDMAYAWVLFLVAVLIFSFVVERGPRYNHGNFLWQVIVCNFILHITTFRDYIIRIGKNNLILDFRDGLFCFGFIYALVCGLIYFSRLILTGNYL